MQNNSKEYISFLYQKIEDKIKKHIKDKCDLIGKIFLSIKSDRELLKELGNFYNELDYEILKKKLLKSDENTTNIYASSINANIKKDSLTIKEKIINFIDCHKNKKEQIEDNYQLFDEDIQDKDFYNELNEYFDKQIQNNISSLEMGKTIFQNYIFYKISFISNTKIDFANNNELIEKMHEILSENQDRFFFSCGDKNDYIHNAIKSDKFDPNLAVDQFANLEDIKIIKLLINKFIGKENSDYRGNALYFNTSGNIKRGSEIYDPPHGFLALGLKVIGKYINDIWLTCKNENSEWAIAYHPIFYIESIIKIIEEGLIPGDSQDKENQNDIRHPGNTIKKGIYLYSKIQLAEDKAKIIWINNKGYKFIIMSRVYIKNIMESDDTKYWILEKDDVRIYRLLVKRYYR